MGALATHSRGRDSAPLLQPHRLLCPAPFPRDGRTAVPRPHAERGCLGHVSPARSAARFENGVYIPLFPSFDQLEISLANGGSVRFDLEGDLWETEDQRNWTDASFKSYRTPLQLGFPHELKEGDRIDQRVSFAVIDLPATSADRGAETACDDPHRRQMRRPDSAATRTRSALRRRFLHAA